MTAVRGVVIVPSGPTPVRNATLRLRILDVPRADDAATTLAETVVTGVSVRAGQEAEIPFALSTDVATPIAHAVVAAHLDLSGDGRVTVGDYVTMESFPIPRTGDALSMRVRIRRVG